MPRSIIRFVVVTLLLALPLPLLAMPAQDTPPAHAPAPMATLDTSLPPALQNFDAYVNTVRQTFDVPGISVAIVKDGKVLLENGYGVREIGVDGMPDKPATAHTLYAIASNTKAFTAASLAILADHGKLDMGDRVIEHLPWFRMSDPYVTHAMRIRDLLAHHSGLSLGAGDLLYWPTTDYSTREVVERLAHVPLKHGFRARYFYDNILFAVAELVVENVANQDFRSFLKQHFFQPLGMSETRFNYHYIKPGDTNVATGYAKSDFTDLKPAKPLAWANNSGAGGIYSSVHDMSKWIIAQLAGGVYGQSADGEPLRLFSEDRHREMWSVQTAINPRPAAIPELEPMVPNFAGYGEGWHLSEYKGHKLVWHTGGWPGFVSRVTMVPDTDLGMVVLTNQQSGAAFQAITYHILDAFLGGQQHDWLAAYVAYGKHKAEEADESWQKHVAARDKNSKPSLPLADYAGVYQDPWYGKVKLRMDDGHLVMQFSHTKALLGDLEHWQHDSFIVRWRNRGLNADAFVTFALDPDGNIRSIRMQPVSPRTDFSFDFQDLRLTPVDADQP